MQMTEIVLFVGAYLHPLKTILWPGLLKLGHHILNGPLPTLKMNTIHLENEHTR